MSKRQYMDLCDAERAIFLNYSDNDNEEITAETIEEYPECEEITEAGTETNGEKEEISAETDISEPDDKPTEAQSGTAVECVESVPDSDDSDDEQPIKSTLGGPTNGRTVGKRIKFALKCAGVLLLLTCVAAAVYFNFLLDKIDYKDVEEFHQYYNLSDTDYVEQNEVYEIPLYYNESTTLEGFDLSMIDIPEKDVLNIMLVGTDLRSSSYHDTGNTDSMILLSINKRDKNIKLTSFMRDMYVAIPGRDSNRLNAAYAYGGPQLLFDTLKLNFNVDVDKYVRVNFSNFKKIIDEEGGIDIELTNAEAEYMNKYAWKYKTKPVQPGLQRLDGAQALSYARCRKIDSDFKRTERQRKVILSFVEELKHKNPAELNSLLNITLPMIQTNMSKTEIVSLLADAGSYMNNQIETLNIPIKNSYKPKTIHKRSVICPNFELNNMAILAHIYSTYQLDVSGTVYRDFETPGSDDEAYKDEDGNVYYNAETGELYTNENYPTTETYPDISVPTYYDDDDDNAGRYVTDDYDYVNGSENGNVYDSDVD